MQRLFFSFFIVMLGVIGNMRAQEGIDYSSPKVYEIAEITVEGIKYLNHNTIIQISGLTIGSKIEIPGEATTRALDKLWAQNMFSHIELSATKIEGEKIYLELFLLERPRLSDFKLVGVRSSDKKEIEEKINLVRGAQVTDNIIINTRNIIRNYYVDKGYFNTDVKINQVEDTSILNTVIMVIDVNRGEKVKIDEIEVEGNTVFTDRKIRRAMKETKKKRWYGFFKPSKYIPAKYEEDLEKIIEKYNEKGYRDARLTMDSVYSVGENMLRVNIKIEEGNQYFFRNITWVGNTKYTSSDLSQVLGIKKGDVYDQSLLDKRLNYDEDAVGNLYMDNGYLFYHVIPSEIANVNDSIDIEMRLYEGKQATVNNVTIVGNTKTNEHVIRREIKTTPGELFSKRDITRTIRELATLGHFDPEKLNVNPVPNVADGTVDLEYIVEERANDQVEISGGWGAGMLVGNVGLSFNNFSARNIFKKDGWQPIPSGDGQQLKLSVRSSGKYYQAYSISFIEPWLGGTKPNSLSVSLYRTVNSNGLGFTDPERIYMITNGFSVGLGQRLRVPDDYFTLYTEFSFQNYNLKDWNYFIVTDGIANNLSFTTVLSRNSLDNPLFTRSGSSFSLSLQITPPYSLLDNIDDYSDLTQEEKFDWIEYHKWKFNAEWYTRIVGDLIFKARGQFGFLGYYNKNLRSPFEGFTMGGDGMTGYNQYGRETIGLKGYENNSLTPDNGANLFNRFTFEVRYPISLNPQATIYAKVFAEAGNAWYDFSDFNPFHNYRAAGVGVRFILPMVGLMGVDWGYGFDTLPGSAEPSGSNWHFVLGQEF